MSYASDEPRIIKAALSCTLPTGELARLNRAIEHAIPAPKHPMVQFASAYAGEGTPLVSFETAISAAMLMKKRVLFLDATNKAQSGAKILFDSVTPLDKLIAEGKTLHSGIAAVEGTNLFYAVLRGEGDGGAALANLNAVTTLLGNLRNSFDLIIINSGALMNDAFSTALVKLVDGTLLVVEAERTRSPVVIETKRRIISHGGTIIGAVFNKRRFYIPRSVYQWLYNPHDHAA